MGNVAIEEQTMIDIADAIRSFDDGIGIECTYDVLNNKELISSNGYLRCGYADYETQKIVIIDVSTLEADSDGYVTLYIRSDELVTILAVGSQYNYATVRAAFSSLSSGSTGYPGNYINDGEFPNGGFYGGSRPLRFLKSSLTTIAIDASESDGKFMLGYEENVGGIYPFEMAEKILSILGSSDKFATGDITFISKQSSNVKVVSISDLGFTPKAFIYYAHVSSNLTNNLKMGAFFTGENNNVWKGYIKKSGSTESTLTTSWASKDYTVLYTGAPVIIENDDPYVAICAASSYVLPAIRYNWIAIG